MKRSHVFSHISLFVFLVAWVIPCIGQTDSHSPNSSISSFDLAKANKIHELVATYAEYEQFSGAVLVAEKGEVMYKHAFGWANREWDLPNQPHTKFRLASVSKQFTAMLIMQLVAENKLALEVPISTYLPTYPKAHGDLVHIHHLLTHTSGIPNYTSFPGYRDMMRNPMKPGEIVRVFADSSLQFTPGERFQYSNSGYVLLGVIIEKITGKSYEQVLQEKILTPLNMKHTGHDHHETILKNRAQGYYRQGGRYVHANYIDMSVAYTAGGLYSTVEDLYRWDQALYTEKLLPKVYRDQVFGKHIDAWGRYYGYGWNIGEMRMGNTKDFVQTIDHDGVINGFSSLILRIPSDRFSIILLNNTGGAALYEMAQSIGGILYDKSYDFPKKSVALALSEVIKKEGIAAGLSFYEEVKDAPTYMLDENEMNLTGYDFLQAGNPEKALAVFKLTVEAFPHSFNAYDSYGEAWMVLGDTTQAINNYQQSLALNPKNENGIEMLKKLGVEVNIADLYLLKTEDNWNKEIFTFPLSFAKDIPYTGKEEAYFPPAWRKLESPEFWSYAIAWDINFIPELTEQELETNLQRYFDGLMEGVNKDKDRVLPHTLAKIRQKEALPHFSRYTGTLNIYDAFVTNENMTLQVIVEAHHCPQTKKSVLVCKFSPKEFEHEIWLELGNIQLRDHVCEN